MCKNSLYPRHKNKKKEVDDGDWKGKSFIVLCLCYEMCAASIDANKSPPSVRDRDWLVVCAWWIDKNLHPRLSLRGLHLNHNTPSLFFFQTIISLIWSNFYLARAHGQKPSVLKRFKFNNIFCSNHPWLSLVCVWHTI